MLQLIKARVVRKSSIMRMTKRNSSISRNPSLFIGRIDLSSSFQTCFMYKAASSSPSLFRGYMIRFSASTTSRWLVDSLSPPSIALDCPQICSRLSGLAWSCKLLLVLIIFSIILQILRSRVLAVVPMDLFSSFSNRAHKLRFGMIPRPQSPLSVFISSS